VGENDRHALILPSLSNKSKGIDETDTRFLIYKPRRRDETNEDRWRTLLHIPLISSKVKRVYSHQNHLSSSVRHFDTETQTRKWRDILLLQVYNREQEFAGK
jgi:hypothetical protein